MRLFLPFLISFLSSSFSIVASPVERIHGPEAATPIGAFSGRRTFVSRTEERSPRPQDGGLLHHRIPDTTPMHDHGSAKIHARAGSGPSNGDPQTHAGSMTARPARHGPKPTATGVARPKAARSGAKNSNRRQSSLTSMETHPVTGKHQLAHATSAQTTSGAFADTTNTAAAPTDTSGAFADTTNTAAAPTDTSFTNGGGDTNREHAPAYNLKNISCEDYNGINKAADKWKAVDGDNAVQAFVSMLDSDLLWCADCFGKAKKNCQSKSRECDVGIRTRTTRGNTTRPSWSVAAAFFGEYTKADGFTCQIGPNECASAPDCKALNGGDGAGSGALLQSLTNAYLAFQSNYDAIALAGSQCQGQMQYFSDVFAPVPHKEAELIALIVMTTILGGLTAFLGPGMILESTLLATAAGVGAGVGMVKYFDSMPGPIDTSSSLEEIVSDVLAAYGNMTDNLFQDGTYSHPSSDGRRDVVMTLQNFTSGGALTMPDADPKNHFTNLVPAYKRIFFQQLAMLTWQTLEVDDKTHIPFIAFDKGACNKVDHLAKGSLNHNGLMGIGDLDVQVDFQGDCYYLLDGIPENTYTAYSSSLDCKGKALPGGSNKAMTDNAKQFADLEVADFIIPSVLGWQAHAKTNGYKAAAANGNLIKDIRSPGTVNIPICDYLTDFVHPGVGCPMIGPVRSDKKCEVIGSGEGHNPQGQYSQGACRAHVVQWQKNEQGNNANQLPDYQLSVDIYDQSNRVVGSATKQDAAKPLEITDTSLPYNLIVYPGALDMDPVSFWYADQYWLSNEHKCKGGTSGGDNEYNNGARNMDCTFDCPLPKHGDTPPASATIAHPISVAPIEAVPGISNYANTFSKTAGPAPAAATPTYVSGECAMKITQYQKHEEKSNPTNDYQVEISVKDSQGGQAANFAKQPCPIGKPMVMHGLRGGDFTITIGKNLNGPLTDSTPISFSYNGQDFDTDTLKCAQDSNNGGYQNGDKQMDCNTNC